MSAGNSGDRFRELEQAYGEYTVYDQHYEKIGKVDDIFVDENDEPEYIGVKTGLLGMKSTLIPIELVRVNDRRKLVEVAADEETIKHAPTFDNDNDITPDYEDRVHGYFGLERPPARQGSGGYGSYYDSSAEASREEELRRSVDTEYGERTGAPERPAATYSGGSTDTNLDIPLEDTGRAEPEASPPQQEVTGTAGDPYAAAAARHQEGSRRDENEVQGDRSVRVFKRTRAVRE
jgi:hypothetical protein